jgi:hypothetical protein
MANANLSKAKNTKNDEFYTQYHDIEKEVSAYLEYNPDVFRGKTILLPCDDPEWSNFTKYFAQNFERFGLKKLISTSYATDSKKYKYGYQPTIFEINDPHYDESKTTINGKIFTLTHDKFGDGKIDVDDLEWHYLDGDGDFKSNEVKKIRDEADIIITNPPFSLFREFLAWIFEADKQFLIIGNLNAAKYKETFPYLKENKIWFGSSYFSGGAAYFIGSPDLYDPEKMSNPKHAFIKDGKLYWRVNGVRWYTNLEHGKRHQPIPLMTMAENIKFSKHKEIKKSNYLEYENYDAIEVPFVNAIPSDYTGIMGVPISFFDKYSPEQFEIIWQASGNTRASAPPEILQSLKYKKHPEDRGGCTIVNGKRTYDRIFIRQKEITI